MEYDIQRMLKYRRPMGHGVERIAYFCPEYNVVIKRSLNFELGKESIQSQEEMALFSRLTEEEKKCFAFLAFVKHHDIIHIVMKKVLIINEILKDRYGSRELFGGDKIVTMCAKVGYKDIHYQEFVETMDKYYIRDLHGANVGLDETGRLVIIDAGITDS